jgi:hypothetical protein
LNPDVAHGQVTSSHIGAKVIVPCPPGQDTVDLGQTLAIDAQLVGDDDTMKFKVETMDLGGSETKIADAHDVKEINYNEMTTDLSDMNTQCLDNEIICLNEVPCNTSMHFQIPHLLMTSGER